MIILKITRIDTLHIKNDLFIRWTYFSNLYYDIYEKIEKCNNSETFQKLCFLSILKRFTHLKYYKSATIEHIEKFFLS